MALNRYSFAGKGKNSNGESFVGKSRASFAIFNAVASGQVRANVHILEAGERLDYLAGINYGDASLWWIIAAASGVGYGLQVPPGTILKIPSNINEVFGVLL